MELDELRRHQGKALDAYIDGEKPDDARILIEGDEAVVEYSPDRQRCDSGQRGNAVVSASLPHEALCKLRNENGAYLFLPGALETGARLSAVDL